MFSECYPYNYNFSSPKDEQEDTEEDEEEQDEEEMMEEDDEEWTGPDVRNSSLHWCTSYFKSHFYTSGVYSDYGKKNKKWSTFARYKQILMT